MKLFFILMTITIGVSYFQFIYCRSLDKYLSFLDAEIVKQLMYPVKDDRNSLYDRINTYNTGLYDVAKAYGKKAEHAIPIANALKKLGMPDFAKVEIDYKKLQQTFDWEDIQITHLKCIIEDTRKLWAKLENPAVKVSGESTSSFQDHSYT
uniref:Uncharacterized protein n=1 Tax=Clastoptera arizonana TaxID=38151 RepID=A0A1B6CH34_9HEMI